MDKDEFENLNLFTEFASRSGFNLFLGAGFSVYAKMIKMSNYHQGILLGNQLQIFLNWITTNIRNLLEIYVGKSNYQKKIY